MGYYDQIGADAVAVRTPGYVLAEIQTTDTVVQTLNADVTRANLPQAQREAWAAFLAEWNAFRDANSSGAGAWLARGTTPVYQKTIDFRRRAREWQDALRAAGGAVSQADRPVTGSDSSWGAWSSWLPWIGLGVVAVGVGGYLLLRPKGGE